MAGVAIATGGEVGGEAGGISSDGMSGVQTKRKAYRLPGRSLHTCKATMLLVGQPVCDWCVRAVMYGVES